jgi:hypothetical protein
MQLYPATISWGLVTTVLPLATLEKKVQALYYKALPLMGINGNIKKEWWSLPTMYQGLGLPSFLLVALSKKISFLQENWGSPGVAQSDTLSLAYDDFLMEVGLYGNPLSWLFTKYSCLATSATWFSNLWQLCHTFMATVSINDAPGILLPSAKTISPSCPNSNGLVIKGINNWASIQFGNINTLYMFQIWLSVMDGVLTPFFFLRSRYHQKEIFSPGRSQPMLISLYGVITYLPSVRGCTGDFEINKFH